MGNKESKSHSKIWEDKQKYYNFITDDDDNNGRATAAFRRNTSRPMKRSGEYDHSQYSDDSDEHKNDHPSNSERNIEQNN